MHCIREGEGFIYLSYIFISKLPVFTDSSNDIIQLYDHLYLNLSPCNYKFFFKFEIDFFLIKNKMAIMF